jgi:hypothetical protein
MYFNFKTARSDLLFIAWYRKFFFAWRLPFDV